MPPVNFQGLSRCDVFSAAQGIVGQNSRKSMLACIRRNVIQHPCISWHTAFSIGTCKIYMPGILNSMVAWVLENRVFPIPPPGGDIGHLTWRNQTGSMCMLTSLSRKTTKTKRPSCSSTLYAPSADSIFKKEYGFVFHGFSLVFVFIKHSAVTCFPGCSTTSRSPAGGVNSGTQRCNTTTRKASTSHSTLLNHFGGLRTIILNIPPWSQATSDFGGAPWLSKEESIVSSSTKTRVRPTLNKSTDIKSVALTWHV